MPQKYLASRINKLPKWARDYIHNVHMFVGAPEVEELTYLRNQNPATHQARRRAEG